MAPVTNSPTTNTSIGGLNLTTAQQNTNAVSIDPLQNQQAQVLMLENTQNQMVVLNANPTSHSRPPQLSTSLASTASGTITTLNSINDSTQDITMLVNQEQLPVLVMNTAPATSMEATNSPQITISSVSTTVSLDPSLIHDPSKMMVTSQQDQQQPQLTLTDVSPQVVLAAPQEQQPTVVNVNTAIYNQMFDPLDHVKRQNDMISSPSTTTSIMDLNRQQQQHQIDQSAVVNPLTAAQAHAVVQAVASAQQVLIQNIMSTEPQQQQDPPSIDQMIIDTDPSVKVHEDAQVQAAVAALFNKSLKFNNDPMNLVESIANAQMVESMNLVEQNRRLAMEIANNNQLAANVNASANNIVSQSVSSQMSISNNQTEQILSSSTQPPPMADLLNSSPIVTTSWSIAPPNNGSSIVVPSAGPIHLINVGEHIVHNTVVVDTSILGNSLQPAQTLTFVAENPQLDMQNAAQKSSVDHVIESSPSQQIQSPSRTVSPDLQVSLPQDDRSKKSPENEVRSQIDNSSRIPSPALNDQIKLEFHNSPPESLDISKDTNIVQDVQLSKVISQPSTTNLQSDIDNVESSKTAKNISTSINKSSNLEDLTNEQLYAKLGQYEHPNYSKDQLIEKVRYYEQRDKNSKNRTSENHKRSRGDSIKSNYSDDISDDNDSPMTPSDNAEDLKRESNRSESTIAGSSQGSPSLTSVKPEGQDEKSDNHRCMWRGCTKVLDSLEALISHVGDSHIGSGKPFTKRHKMYNHLRTHTGERPFVCSVNGCGKRFSRPDSLTTHVKTHSNHRPYICSFKGCNKAYYHSRSLRKHEKTHDIRAAHSQHSLPSVHSAGISITNNGMHINFTSPNRLFSSSQQQTLFQQRPPGFDPSSNPLPSQPPSGQHGSLNYYHPPPLQPHRPELVHHSRGPSFDGSQQQGPSPSSSSPSPHFFAHSQQSSTAPTGRPSNSPAT
ncbi:11931_t:CDS:2, partial [Racocetra fulgida]